MKRGFGLPPKAPAEPANRSNYYLWLNEEQTGPFTIVQLRSMWLIGTITGATIYWQEGMQEWHPLSELTSTLEESPVQATPTPISAKRVDPSTLPPPPSTSQTPQVVVRIFIYIILGIVAAGWLVPACTRQASTISWSRHRYTIRVTGQSGMRFSGTIGCDGQARTVTDAVPASFDLDGSGCVAVLQKQSSSQGVLTVEIQRDHEQVAEQSTTAAYGVAQVAAR